MEANAKFERLVAVEPDVTTSGRWWFRCDCGTIKSIRATHVTAKAIRSCGCLNREAATARRLIHGQSHTALYLVWQMIISRCENPTVVGYDNYGGRGIRICDQWRDSFETFSKDIGLRPTPYHSIDRINTDGNYEPGNCRWATRAEQARNTRRNHNITWDGQTLCLVDWAKKLGIKRETLARRFDNGWSVARAMTTPTRKRT